jgi:hypothetical protein
MIRCRSRSKSVLIQDFLLLTYKLLLKDREFFMMRALHLFISLSLVICSPARVWAQNTSAYLEYLDQKTSSDYVIKRHPNQKLVPVRVIGGVNKPGFYQIPENTPLLSLLSYSGGTAPNSNLKEVTILREDQKASLSVNLKDALTNPKNADITMMSNDVVFIPEEKPFISHDTFMVIAIVSTITATLLTGLIIDERLKSR